ncbi:unnamed protein product [Allacma fusca]|uniref:Uncharacterized protein n=1 Tax=Allacma fusca TaxID=39272 RepID=A0A8J2JVE9_9HEXA|nr:unnamed protein product [Allacma fusca]
MRGLRQERDKVTLNVVSTFSNHSKPFDIFPMDLHKDSMSNRWKKVYTGEDSKEREIYEMVKERQSKAVSRVQRFQKLKGSFRARNAILDVEDAKRIQQKMTEIYFTPKSQVIRKRHKVFLRVTVAMSEL